MILALVVFAVTDPRNSGGPGGRLAPVFIGLTVSALISVIAPLSQACFNPARDFGPRLFAYLAGWGTIALPGPTSTGFITVYILAPLAGAIAGGGIYDFLIRPGQPADLSPQPRRKGVCKQSNPVSAAKAALATTVLNIVLLTPSIRRKPWE
jgi:hypothetical protein